MVAALLSYNAKCKRQMDGHLYTIIHLSEKHIKMSEAFVVACFPQPRLFDAGLSY